MENPVQQIVVAIAKNAAEQASVEARIHDLDAELSQIKEKGEALATARRVLVDLGYEPSASSISSTPKAQLAGNRSTKLVIQDVLKSGPLWWTAVDIQAAASQLSGRDIPLSTISPYLSDLKKVGILGRKSMNVALISRIQIEEPNFLKTNDPPKGGSFTEDVDASSNS
jgi:hypothetical protein